MQRGNSRHEGGGGTEEGVHSNAEREQQTRGGRGYRGGCTQ